MAYQVTIILAIVVMAKVCMLAEDFAMKSLAASTNRIGWIDRQARIAFILSDCCAVVFAFLMANFFFSLVDMQISLSIIPFK